MERPERNAWIPSVRVYPWERELLLSAAATDQVSVSEFIRTTMLTAARRKQLTGADV